MIKQLRQAEAADLSTLKKLWKACFGDEDAYIDFYYQEGYSMRQTLVLALNDVVVSMLTLIPVTLRTGKTTLHGQYIYAVATDPNQRGKGLMRELMEHAHARCRQQKQDFVCLVPANPSLFELYGKLGYTTCTTQERVHFPVGEAMTSTQVQPCTKDAYFQARNAWLLQMEAAVSFDNPHYLMAEMTCTGSETLWVETALGNGFAAVYLDGETLLLRETSLSKEAVEQASKVLCTQYACKQLVARFPQGDTPYAMWKPLQTTWESPSCYMNLMLD